MLQHPPEFLIIGAARSGTSALASSLDQHPQIRFTRPKETHFFAFAGCPVDFKGPGDDVMVNNCTTTNPKDFESLVGKPQPNVLRGEGSVSTLYYHEHSVPSIKTYAPDARLIVILRHPIDRAYSSFQYMRSKGFEPLDDFCEALAQEQQRIEANWHHIWHYARMGMYSESVAAFMSNFARKQIKLIFYDEFEEDAVGLLRDIFRFLNVDTECAVDTDLRVNRSGSVRNQFMAGMIKKVIRNDYLRRTAKALIPFRVRETLRNVAFEKSDVSATARQQLWSVFEEDIYKLQQIVGSVPAAWLSR